MLRLNSRDIWRNPAASLGPKQHWTPGEELCWAWLITAGVTSDSHEAHFGHDLSPHRDQQHQVSSLHDLDLDFGPHLSCLDPQSTYRCHSQCLSGGQRHHSPSAEAVLSSLSLNLLPHIFRVKSLQSSPECTKPHFFHLLFRGFYGLFLKCLVTWELMKTSWASLIFNPLLLWNLSFKIFWVFPLTQLLTAFLLWINICSSGPVGGSSVHNCSIYSSSSCFFLISSWFQAATDPISLTGLFPLSLVWPLWSAGRSRKRERTEWRSNGKREEMKIKDAF